MLIKEHMIALNEQCKNVNKTISDYETAFAEELSHVLEENNLLNTVQRFDGLKGKLIIMKLGGENKSIIPYSAAFYPEKGKSRRVDTAAYESKTPEEYFERLLKLYKPKS